MTLNDYYKGYKEDTELIKYLEENNKKLSDKDIRKYQKIRREFHVAFNNFRMSDAGL